MDDVLADLADQHAELDGILAGLSEDDWARASACEGWSVADVVVHLTQSDEGAVASVEGRLPEGGLGGQDADVDDWAERMVVEARGASGGEVFAAWRSTTAALRAALAETDLSARVPWVTGRLSARTLATTRLAECWIHTGDVAAAFGEPPSATNRLRLIARLAWRTLPYAFERAGRPLSGPVAFELRAPDGERWDLVPPEEPAHRGPGRRPRPLPGGRPPAATRRRRACGPPVPTPPPCWSSSAPTPRCRSHPRSSVGAP